MISQEEIDELLDFLAGKPIFEPIRKECQDIADSNENLLLSIQGAEREVYQQMSELNLVKEQIAGCRRVIDESLSSQVFY
jgi:flagellar motor switch protein FliM